MLVCSLHYYMRNAWAGRCHASRRLWEALGFPAEGLQVAAPLVVSRVREFRCFPREYIFTSSESQAWPDDCSVLALRMLDGVPCGACVISKSPAPQRPSRPLGEVETKGLRLAIMCCRRLGIGVSPGDTRSGSGAAGCSLLYTSRDLGCWVCVDPLRMTATRN